MATLPYNHSELCSRHVLTLASTPSNAPFALFQPLFDACSAFSDISSAFFDAASAALLVLRLKNFFTSR